jgi:hypothetical protein
MYKLFFFLLVERGGYYENLFHFLDPMGSPMRSPMRRLRDVPRFRMLVLEETKFIRDNIRLHDSRDFTSQVDGQCVESNIK